jgi:xylulokinase
MADQLFIGIDSGTQGTKVVIVSEEKRKIVAEGYAAHELVEGPYGRREQEPEWWITACREAITAALTNKDINPGEVKSIGVSGQQHGMVPLDSEGKVLRAAKLWCDTETAPQCDQLTKKLGGLPSVIELIGNAIAAGFTASKILWFKENDPANYDKLQTVLLPHDYINFWFTGERKTEYGDASGTAYFDIRERRWSQEVLQAIDKSGKLTACMPEIIQAHEAVGTVKKEIARKFGFNDHVLVAAGGGDNMMAAIGTGNVVPGIVTASLGTSGTIYCVSETPVVDAQGELAAFCSSSGSWLPLVCTMNVTVATELTRTLFGLSLEQLTEEIAAAQPGAGGIILLPYFNGERTPPLPMARATLFGLDRTNYTRQNICRAAMEGATFGLKYGLDVLERNGIVPEEIRLVGGGAKSAIWRHIVADIFNCPVVCPASKEAGALGAALQALWCYRSQDKMTPLKEITNDFIELDQESYTTPRKYEVMQYRDQYQSYLRLNESLKPVY